MYVYVYVCVCVRACVRACMRASRTEQAGSVTAMHGIKQEYESETGESQPDARSAEG